MWSNITLLLYFYDIGKNKCHAIKPEAGIIPEDFKAKCSKFIPLKIGLSKLQVTKTEETVRPIWVHSEMEGSALSSQWALSNC